MAIASVEAWLKNPDRKYETGKLLYQQYGDSSTLTALLNSGSTNFHFTKLKSALEKINNLQNLEPKQIKVPEVLQVEYSGSKKTKIDFTSAPDQIIQIKKRKDQAYASARHLHAAIRVMDNQEHRLEAGLQVLDLMDLVNDSWAILDAWNKDGKVSELKEKQQEKDVKSMALQELLREQANLAPNISKDKKRLVLAKSDKTKLKITQRLESRHRRLTLVKERIEKYAL